jgi:hypothetical protein
MIVELAIATRISVREWWHASDAVLATAIVVLDERNKANKAAVRGK